ncbi:5369_t:CDS:1 [Acaulospora colombiana]|uniref:5369_t:CDS:1 n=1 Tax=Acaulospora colombiana TaxID=27376 RepID=A0ACA9P2B6_9GLOM|nr:5369_t:CDS:1 [Acaulospora colombiana]
MGTCSCNESVNGYLVLCDKPKMDLGDDSAGGNGSNWDHLSWQAAAAVGRRRRRRQRGRNADRTVMLGQGLHCLAGKEEGSRTAASDYIWALYSVIITDSS